MQCDISDAFNQAVKTYSGLERGSSRLPAPTPRTSLCTVVELWMIDEPRCHLPQHSHTSVPSTKTIWFISNRQNCIPGRDVSPGYRVMRFPQFKSHLQLRAVIRYPKPMQVRNWKPYSFYSKHMPVQFRPLYHSSNQTVTHTKKKRTECSVPFRSMLTHLQVQLILTSLCRGECVFWLQSREASLSQRCRWHQQHVGRGQPWKWDLLGQERRG